MSKKIMICDDDQGILEMMEVIMEEYGFQSFTQINSTKIFEDIKRERPDLLLLDIWMPAMSGDQVFKQIKSNPDFSDLKVMMYSASAEGVAIAKKSGADDYIAKPFDLEVLIDKIKTLTGAS